MKRAVVSLRLSGPELQFIDALATEKRVTRAAALHHLFLQQVALVEIEKAVSRLVDSRLHDVRVELTNLRSDISAAVHRDDLIKATNFIVQELKK